MAGWKLKNQPPLELQWTTTVTPSALLIKNAPHTFVYGTSVYHFRCLQNNSCYQIMTRKQEAWYNAMIVASRLQLPVVPASRLPDPVKEYVCYPVFIVCAFMLKRTRKCCNTYHLTAVLRGPVRTAVRFRSNKHTTSEYPFPNAWLSIWYIS